MSEQPPNTFEIATSQSVQETLGAFNITVESDAAALSALAKRLKAPLPEQPRVVVVDHDEVLPIGVEQSALLVKEPRLEPENDLLVVLPRDGLSQGIINSGVALALMQKRRARQRTLGGRVGGGLVAAGIAVMAAGAPTQNDTIAGIGGGIFFAGGSLIAYVYNRSAPKVPPASTLPAPVRLRW
jgi:hypothetical protein